MGTLLGVHPIVPCKTLERELQYTNIWEKHTHLTGPHYHHTVSGFAIGEVDD